MNQKKDKKIDNFIIIGIFLMFIPFWILRFKTFPMPPDLANFMLRSEDIVSGNFFLTGWFLTGLTCGTDIIFYVIGYLFFGLSEKGYVIAHSLILISFLITGVLLLKEKKTKWKDILLFLFIVGFPNLLDIINYTIHTGAVIFGLLGLFFTNKFLNENSYKKSYLFCIILSFSFGVSSDPLILFVSVLPILVYSSYILLYNYVNYQKKELDKKHKIIIVISIFAIFLGVLMEKLYFAIGKANKNSYLKLQKFNTLEDFLFKKIPLYIESVMKISDTYFFSDNIISLNHFNTFFRMIILLIGVYYIVLNISLWLKKAKSDYISTILGMGFILASLMFLISENVNQLGHSRYINFFIVFFGIIIVRNIQNFSSDKLKNDRIFILLVLFSIFSIKFSNLEIKRKNTFDEHKKIVDVLQQNELKYGFDSFYDASLITVKSKGKIRMGSVIYNSNNEISNWNWDTKLDNYKKNTNFVVLDNKDPFGINEATVLQQFGRPIKEIKVLGTNKIVFIYDKDISKLINLKEISVTEEEQLKKENQSK